jgi:hypothetical protein
MGKNYIEGSWIVMDQILIDFQGGTHGNFLEFLLNKFYYNAHTWRDPFTEFGTSHNKPYNNREVKFSAFHYTNPPPTKFRDPTIINRNNNVILITFTVDDLLLLMSVSLLRSGDQNIENNYLEIDTYNKLNNEFYHSLLENITKSYLITDCTPNNPNISRHILREFFKFGFKNPEINGFMEKMVNSKRQLIDKNIYEFPFSDFYNIERLKYQLTNIGKYFKIELTVDELTLNQLHGIFLDKNPYVNLKSQCDSLIKAVVDKEITDIPKLNLFQESYINAQLETLYEIEMPFLQQQYFKTTKEILNFIDQKQREQ